MKFGLRSILLFPIALFFILYTWRFVSDAYLDPIPLRYLDTWKYSAYIFPICGGSFLAGLCFDRQTKINSTVLLFAFTGAVCICLYRGDELQSGRFGADIMGPIGAGYLAAASIVVAVCIFLQGGYFSIVLMLASLTCSVTLLVRTASRGPILALFFTVWLLWIRTMVRGEKTDAVKAIVLGSIVLSPLAFRNRFELNDRVALSVDNYIDLHNSGARDSLYRASFEQFLASPVTGNSIELQDCGDDIFYPHNLAIESFQATGIFGGLAFCFTQLLGLGIAGYLIFRQPGMIIPASLHILTFVQGCFSGALATHHTYWLTLGMMLGCLKMAERQAPQP